jgi:hypothetical protein
LADITDLYVAKFGTPPAGKRNFIQSLQQINGWRDRPMTTRARVLAPHASPLAQPGCGNVHEKTLSRRRAPSPDSQLDDLNSSR